MDAICDLPAENVKCEPALPSTPVREVVVSAQGLGLAVRGGQKLVENISLRINTGARLAIIGPNGAGKTTLLKILAGLIPAGAGVVKLFGQPIHSITRRERARMLAVVGQSDAPHGRIRLSDYVGLGRVPHTGQSTATDDLEHVDEALVRVGLHGKRDRELCQLSGGERQRAHIARALAQQPKILFLDEPTNHLDLKARGELMALVARLGLTVIAVLHDLALVPDFATDVLVLEDGRAVASGSPAQALSPATVRDVFGLEVLRLRHPTQQRDITVFDLPDNF
ncbi:ATP-binding cassette domain-containing protein [Mesorhizobium sp. NBSH29]|uniref:ABC transporter ATP-binding protein n=1 Tax=Mesorhizobium sp. NBSH29 TaxID=2654249 RepID=UPI0018964CB3|nr:ABC transporter ATP-binding protein [Mesorhizobium sp. NBSH29]QPC87810.1 ATP-binding cassette domain-containing protein [Mesorhizobium sp. NBSH29]